MTKYNFETNSIHSGAKQVPERALNYPIFMTSTFSFDNLDQVEKTFSFETDDYVYTRGNNPTIRVFERTMATLSNGEDAVAFSSGMAAISNVIMSFLGKKGKVLAHNVIYGSAYNFIKNILSNKGHEVDFIDFTQQNIEEYMDHNIDLIYFETPVNPTLNIIDIKKVVNIAQKYDIKVVVDNTFATPYLQSPLDLGADVVVHSTTKYINGHGDAVGGVAVSKDADYINELKFDYMSEYGGVMSPFNAWLMVRGLKTLKLRMDKHQSNALELAKFLENHDKIEKVFYPGLESFEQHEIAKKQMNGFGAMLSFEIDIDLENIDKFIKNLDLMKLAVSLGDAETLIEIPFKMTHRDYSLEDLDKMGISKNLVRISLGLESANDLINDISNALKQV